MPFYHDWEKVEGEKAYILGYRKEKEGEKEEEDANF